MTYSQKRLKEAIKIAERMAEREIRTEFFKNNNAPEEWINDSRQLVGQSHVELINDSLVEKMLPQARRIVAMEQARTQALEETMLGQLSTATAFAQQYYEKEATAEDKYTLTKLIKESFQDSDDVVEFENLMQHAEKGNLSEMFSSLMSLISGVKIDLVSTDLPPVAPKYHAPEE